MLTWTEGKHELGCAWHKVGDCKGPDATVHVDLFVLEQVARNRPIAIKLRAGLPRRTRVVAGDSMTDPADTSHLHSGLVPVLERGGIATETATRIVDDIVAFVRDNADVIRVAIAPASQ